MALVTVLVALVVVLFVIAALTVLFVLIDAMIRHFFGTD